MVGGPGDMASGQKNDSAVKIVNGSPESAPKKIFVGTKEFKSEQELVNYTQGLERKMLDSTINQPVKALENANKPKISELIFSDPETYTEATIQEAERRIESKIVNQNNVKQSQDDFWKENPDLVAHKEIVDMAIAYRRDAYKDLPIKEGLSKIAIESRELVSKIKGTPQGGKELSSSPAVVAGSSNANTTAQVAVKAAPMNMVEALRQKQRKGKS